MENGDEDPPSVPSGSRATNWEKILWRRQPYPDNYVPDSFLSELKHLRKSPRPRPSLVSLLFAALPVTQHVAVITFFVAVFYALLVGHAAATEVGTCCAVAALLGFGIRKWGWGSDQLDDRRNVFLPPPTPLRPLILPPLLLSLLSPVLGTLTSATTSDSIWPLAGGLFFVHILLADFTTGKDARLRRREARKREIKKRRGSASAHGHEVLVEEKSLASSLSLTSALSASIVLASRLPSTAHVFSLVLLAVLLFAGWPVMAKGVRESGRFFSLILTFSLLMLTISIIPTTSISLRGGISQTVPPTTLIFLCIILAVNVIGPGMLWYGWRWKTRRGGNWEVAVVKVRKGSTGR